MITPLRDRNPGSVTPENVVAYREAFGIASPDQLRRVIDLRGQLAAAHAGILELFGDPEGDLAETLDGIETGIGLMGTIIEPTGDAIAELLFIDSDDEAEDADLAFADLDLDEDDW